MVDIVTRNENFYKNQVDQVDIYQERMFNSNTYQELGKSNLFSLTFIMLLTRVRMMMRLYSASF